VRRSALCVMVCVMDRRIVTHAAQRGLAKSAAAAAYVSNSNAVASPP